MQLHFQKIQQFFPSGKKEWSIFARKTIPIVFSAIFFTLNSFVDNFMVTGIPNGVGSLGYANSWTAITFSFFVGISTIGSIFVGQYYGSKNFTRLKEVIHLRIWLSLACALIFASVAWTVPKPFLSVFSHGQDPAEAQTVRYLQIIAFTWILVAFTSNTGNLLRETGHSTASFWIALGVLTSNISFNAIFVYGLKFGVEGTAYASIIARVFAITFNSLMAWKVDRKIFVNFLKLYKVSFTILKQFQIRAWAILISSVSINVVVFRSSFWYAGFPSVGDLSFFITGAQVLGLTATLTNIMTSGLASINGTINYFVGRPLGLSQYEIAEKNAKKVEGFNFIIGIGLSVIILIATLIVTNLDFFAASVYQNAYTHNYNQLIKNGVSPAQANIEASAVANNAMTYYLSELRNTIYVVAFYNPTWMLVVTALRISGVGGKNNFVSSINLTGNLIQIGWLAILVHVILPVAPGLRNSLPWSYALFFVSDIILMFVYNTIRHKMKWMRNVNDEYDKINSKKALRKTAKAKSV